jgi:chromosome segregation ATPase
MSKTKTNSDNLKEDYKNYTLTVRSNTDKKITDFFYGEAHEKGVQKSNANKVCSLHGNNRDDLLKQLKESIDNRENKISESKNQQISPTITNEIITEKIDVITQETEARTDLKQETNSVGVDAKNVEKDKLKTKSTESDGSASIEKILEKHFSSLSKKIEKLEERLEKLESNRELTSKIEALTQITKQNNVDKFSSDFAEKLQVQEQRLIDIFNKIDTLAEAEFLNGHLTQLQSQSEKLHERLDNKIDLKDAEHLFDLRNEIEKDIESNLIQTISKKIMPVLDNLKDKIKNDPEKISDAMQDLESRCISAGLKRLRGI